MVTGFQAAGSTQKADSGSSQGSSHVITGCGQDRVTVRDLEIPDIYLGIRMFEIGRI